MDSSLGFVAGSSLSAHMTGLKRAPLCSRRSTFVTAGQAVTLPNSAMRSSSTVRMGLFGLGFPELAVIGGVAAVIFGPAKITELGKSLGGVAGSVKKATNEFQEAMSESIAEADKEIETRKKNRTIDGTAVDVDEKKKSSV